MYDQLNGFNTIHDLPIRNHHKDYNLRNRIRSYYPNRSCCNHPNHNYHPRLEHNLRNRNLHKDYNLRNRNLRNNS